MSWKMILSSWKIIREKTDNELRIPPGNSLEELKRERKCQHSIRINDQYRLCFKWTEAGPMDVEIKDYH